MFQINVADRNFGSLVTAGWELGKVPLCMLISCSAGFGALLAVGQPGWTVVIASIGVFLLAIGGATFNSLQEVGADSKMKRTAARPLVERRLTSEYALIQGIGCTVFGIWLLGFLPAPTVPILFGVLALALYNLVYTPMKRLTVLSIFPGAVCGVFPLLIGWVGGGGSLESFTALLLFTLLFLWQVPHFCLVLLRHQDDYLHTDIPNLLKIVSERGLCSLSCAWIWSLAIVMLLFAVCAGVSHPAAKSLVAFNAVFCALGNTALLYSKTGQDRYRRVFICLNFMLMAHMIVISSNILIL